MKKTVFLLLFTTLFFGSCVVTSKYHTYYDIINFNYLTEKGIFATTSNSVSFEYKPLGIVSGISSGGYFPKNKKEEHKAVRGYNNKGTQTNYKYPDLDDAFKELYKGLEEIGANGVIDLNIKYGYKETKYGRHLSDITITGMAIKK